jgi:hypothetical protein
MLEIFSGPPKKKFLAPPLTTRKWDPFTIRQQTDTLHTQKFISFSLYIPKKLDLSSSLSLPRCSINNITPLS